MKTDHRDSDNQISVTVNNSGRHTRFSGNQSIRRSYSSSCGRVNQSHYRPRSSVPDRNYRENQVSSTVSNITDVNRNDYHQSHTNWPLVREIPRNQPKATLVSDSLGKRLHLPYVDIQAIGGLYVEKAARYVRLNTNINIKDYNIIILHIGTIDLKFLNPQEFATFYQNLLDAIKGKNPEAILAISGIIQRPYDFRRGVLGKDTEAKRRAFNQELKRLSVWYRINFLKTYKQFQYFYDPSQPDRRLFVNTWQDGIHLNALGSRVFSSYLGGVFSMLRGKWFQNHY